MPDHKLLLALCVAFAAILPCRPADANASSPLPAVIVKTRTTDIVVQPDGSYTTIFHEEKLATNEGAAHNIAQQPIEYAESMEAVEILDAFTRKADGKVLAVDLTQLVARAPPAVPGALRFADHKQKVIMFPELNAGDTVVFTIRRTGKPSFAGQFFAANVFPRGLAVEEVQENFTIPKSLAAHVEAHSVDHQVEEDGASITHKFVYRNPRPQTQGANALSPWDTDPHYVISTFADYAAIVTAYRQLSEDKAEVTPRIQALADEVTEGETDRRAQARRIYDWVSAHIRYVAVALGNGSMEPHDAASVLENGYGDCKDHVALLAALLKAENIASVPVLIDGGNRYQLPETATPAAFNHALSYLPEFDLYADSTIGVAPFGTLLITEYGKPVAVAADIDAGLRTLPLAAAEENEETLQTTAELKADGTVSGRSTTTASGPFSITLRLAASRIEASGREQIAATQLSKFGWAGKGRYDFDPPNERLDPSYSVSGFFELEKRPEFLEGKPFALPAGLRSLVQPGQFLAGYWALAKTEPTPCFSGHQVDELSLTLPPGRDIEQLPSGNTVDNDYLHYQSVWSRGGQVISLRREITVRLPVAVCRDEVRAKLAEAIAEIRRDYSSKIALKPLVQ